MNNFNKELSLFFFSSNKFEKQLYVNVIQKFSKQTDTLIIVLSTNSTSRMQKHHHTENNVQETMLASKQNRITVKTDFLDKMIVLCKAIREKCLQYDDNEDLRSCTLTYI